MGLDELHVTLSPKSSGVMSGFLFQKVRRRVRELLNGYVSSKSILENIGTYILPPGLGNQSGSLGAIALAMQAEERKGDPRI
jgi:fructokinase